MGDKTRPLCKWKQSRYIKDLELLKSIVSEPKLVCRDCGRVAKDKRWICKAVKI